MLDTTSQQNNAQNINNTQLYQAFIIIYRGTDMHN